MPATVTEKWSDREWTRGKSGRRSWIVSEVTTGLDAVAAVIAQAGVDVNSAFPEESRLRADTDPSAKQLGPKNWWEVGWNYIRPEAGSVTEEPDDPLDDPPKFRWAQGTFSIPTDIDADGYPVVNAVGLPFDGGFTSDIRFRILTVTKNQSAYNPALSINFENTFNNANFNIPGVGTIAPGQMLCVSIEPTAEYDETSEYVPVAYTFHIWRGWNLDSDGVWDSWKARTLNVSRSGWWDDGGTPKLGNFVNLSGEPVTEPVLLNATGTPMLSGKYKVDAGSAGLKTPATGPVGTGPVFETTTNATFIKFRKARAADFAGLTLFA